jgi:hypothetical protein
MDAVHFLNIEYLLLRAYDFFSAQPLVDTAYSTAEAPASSTIHPIAVTFGTFALVGMLVSLVFFVIVVWIRIRLEVVEHEGFHAREHEEELHQEVAAPEAPAKAKNERWERVQTLMSGSSESDWRLAVLEADIMLNDMLIEQGYRGESIGERLRDANPLQFTTLDLAWKAHKVRNDIAHAGADYHLSQRDANATIDEYRRVFEEFNFV